MGPVLKGLIELQSVEGRLRGMRARLIRFKRAVVMQQQVLKQLETTKQTHEDTILDSRVNVDKLELELQSRDETVNKYKDALNKSRNNKEYVAILTELNTNKADNSKIESRILEYMEVIDDNRKACEQLDLDIEKQNQTIEDVKDKAAGKIAECEASIAEIEAQWNEFASHLPQEVLELFKKLSDTFDGEAVAFVQQSGNKQVSYSCGGCFMNVTAEAISRLISFDEISQCKNCGRILVIDDSGEQR